MTELDLSSKLGILSDPDKNRVHVDPLLQAEITYLSHIFQLIDGQKQTIGTINPDIWCELLPWHSMN